MPGQVGTIREERSESVPSGLNRSMSISLDSVFTPSSSAGGNSSVHLLTGMATLTLRRLNKPVISALLFLDFTHFFYSIHLAASLII